LTVFEHGFTSVGEREKATLAARKSEGEPGKPRAQMVSHAARHRSSSELGGVTQTNYSFSLAA
jgi:hypothetical protein